MTSHPITPPPELVQQWDTEGRHQDYCTVTEHIATRAAQWGADQELEACCDWLNYFGYFALGGELRAARRPKPPSLKEQALAALPKRLDNGFMTPVNDEELDTIRLALEALPDD